MTTIDQIKEELRENGIKELTVEERIQQNDPSKKNEAKLFNTDNKKFDETFRINIDKEIKALIAKLAVSKDEMVKAYVEKFERINEELREHTVNNIDIDKLGEEEQQEATDEREIITDTTKITNTLQKKEQILKNITAEYIRFKEALDSKKDISTLKPHLTNIESSLKEILTSNNHKSLDIINALKNSTDIKDMKAVSDSNHIVAAILVDLAKDMEIIINREREKVDKLKNKSKKGNSVYEILKKYEDIYENMLNLLGVITKGTAYNPVSLTGAIAILDDKSQYRKALKNQIVLLEKELMLLIETKNKLGKL